MSNTLTTSRIKVASTILFHSTCAIANTLVSKAALNSLDAPVLLLAVQFTVQVILLTAVGVPLGWINPRVKVSTWKSIAPLTLARVIGILAKTFCLAVVDAAFYQIARGLLLPFTLLLSLIMLRPRPYYPPLSLVGICAVMLGFGVGLSNDVLRNLTGIMGIVLGIGSSFTTAVESVVVKRYLTPKKSAVGEKNDEGVKQEELGVWQMVWMSNVLSLIIFFPLVVVTGNGSTLFKLLLGSADLAPETSRFLPIAFAVGFIGFLLTIATFMQIEVTSPTTHMIVTASRGVAQSGLAMLLLREALTGGRLGSMALILGGSALYGWAKDRSLKRKGAGAQEQPQGMYVDVEKEKDAEEAGIKVPLMNMKEAQGSAVEVR